MKKLMVIPLLLLVSIYSVAQTNLKSGWVQLNNGDTVYGKIKERDWNINPVKIEFETSTSVNYSVADLKSFGITGGEIYRRYNISTRLLPGRENDQYPEDESKIETFDAWLRMVVTGPNSLGVLYLKSRPYFYLIDEKGIAIELVYSNGQKSFADQKYASDSRFGQTISYENNDFRTQLTALFPSQSNLLLKTVYTEQSLEKVFLKTNTGSALTVKGKSNNELIIKAGVSNFSSRISPLNEGPFANGTINNATSPFFGITYNIRGTRSRSKVSFVPGIGITFFNTTGTKSDFASNSVLDIKNTFLDASLSIRYLFTPESKSKIFAEAGLNGLINISGENTTTKKFTVSTAADIITKNDPNQKKALFAPSVSVGCMFSKFGIFVNYQYMNQISNYADAGWSLSRISGGIFYAFKKRS